MTNDQLEDTIRTLLDRIDALETSTHLMNERLNNHAEQIKIVDEKVNDVCSHLLKVGEIIKALPNL